MASIRLTNAMRDEIKQAVLRHKFKEKHQELIEKRAKLALAVYNAKFSAKEQEAMAALPKGWMRTENTMQPNFAGQRGYLYFNGGSADWRYALSFLQDQKKVDVEKIMPYTYEDPAFPADHPLNDLWTEIQSDEVTLKCEVDQAGGKLNGVLYNVTTVGKLATLWPELRPFFKHYEHEERTLPAIKKEELNELFNLPIEEQE